MASKGCETACLAGQPKPYRHRCFARNGAANCECARGRSLPRREKERGARRRVAPCRADPEERKAKHLRGEGEGGQTPSAKERSRLNNQADLRVVSTNNDQ
jgi:hypothetical protein